MLLAGSICLARARELEAYVSVMRMLSAAGLAASALFAAGILYQLTLQIARALGL